MRNEMQHQRRRGGSPPTITLSSGPITKARDNTFSTVIFVGIGGWWENGRPNQVELYIGQAAPVVIGLQDGRASYPLVGLQPESHIVVRLLVREHSQSCLVVAPPLPPGKQPKRFEYKWGEAEGKYFLHLSVLDEDGRPVPATMVRVILENHGTVAKFDIRADKRGSCARVFKVPPGESWLFTATLPGFRVEPIKRRLTCRQGGSDG